MNDIVASVGLQIRSVGIVNPNEQQKIVGGKCEKEMIGSVLRLI